MVGIGTATPSAGLTVGTGSNNNATEASDVYVSDDIEIDGTAFALNFNGTNATFSTTNTGKLLASGSINGANLNLSANANVVKLLASSNINGANLNLSSMTDGSVPFFGASGALSQDNNSLFWDRTNKRFGIGTKNTSSLAALVVAPFVAGDSTLQLKAHPTKASGTKIFRITNSDNGALVSVGKNGSTFFNEQGLADADFRIDGDTQGNLLFVDASADNIGIGTGSPTSFKLEVKGDIGPSANNTYNLGSNAKNGIKSSLTPLTPALFLLHLRRVLFSSVVLAEPWRKTTLISSGAIVPKNLESARLLLMLV